MKPQNLNNDFEKDQIKSATFDLRFLLDRGYRKKGALKFVADRYLLDKKQKNYLVRTVFSREKSMARKDKIVDITFINGKTLFVDGYNVIITVESICSDDQRSVVVCDDGVLRDVNAVFGKYKYNEWTETALNQIISLLKSHNPLSVKFFYDSPVSRSGELAKLTNRIINSHGVSGCAVTSKNVDFELKKLSNDKDKIVATSDGAIIDKVKNVLDVPRELCKLKNMKRYEKSEVSKNR
jgi:hypothetical protein